MENNFLLHSLFPEYDKDIKSNLKKMRNKRKWQIKKSRNFGLEYCRNAQHIGKYGIPLIRKYTDSLPKRFITLREATTLGSPTTGVVGFAYDEELEDYLYRPERHLSKLLNYKCIGELDFSMRVLDPFAVVVANMFRSHSAAFYYQEHGCKILPSPKWSTSQSFEVCFDGYERGGAVIVSTIGVLRDERSRLYFKNGFQEMLKRLAPDAVVVYGTAHDWIKELMPAQLDVHYFEHERFNWMKKYGK